MSNKSIYFFGLGKADGNGSMKEILGGKGANLAEMSKMGISVPCGFTISTVECNKYYENGCKISSELELEIEKYVKKLEKVTGNQFGSEKKPLLVSVRSGAKFSMPGMMDTVLNLGLNDKTVEILAKLTNNPRFAYDSYRRFIQMYSDVVLGISHDHFETILDDIKFSKNIFLDSELSAVDLFGIIEKYKKIVKKEKEIEFEQDIKKQLLNAIEAVFKSWMNDRAIVYRKLNNIPDSCGTAVNIQAMVFGNMGDTSATGVAFTRNPSTGEDKIYGEYLINAQGEDVVAGIRTPQSLLKLDGKNSMEEMMPNVYQELAKTFKILERHYKDMQDVEFTVQEGKLWILQTRNGKRSAKASVKIAVDLAENKIISKNDAISRIEPDVLNQILHPILDRSKKLNVIARGLPASPGAVSGKIVFSSQDAEEWHKKGQNVILVRSETSPEDIGGMHASVGILTCKGGMTSHAAVVARGMGKPCISGCGDIVIDLKSRVIMVKNTDIIIKESDIITIDGGIGEVILGKAETTSATGFKEFDTLMLWVDEIRKVKVRVNAETAIDCKTAIKFGADGIGLCRTEHMFFDKKKLLAFRKMILSNSTKDRINALETICKLQISDFEEIFEIMNGLPVNIRLLDPPLHEFVPHTELEIDNFCEHYSMDKAEVVAKIKNLHEQNPMLGHRGSRLGITYPEIFEMQVKAIFEAAIKLQNTKNVISNIEIMLPVIMETKELKIMIDLVRSTAEKIITNAGINMNYKVGTMIEIPRACLIADKLAEIADYFSFGTNDLTQTTLGISRDDAGTFLGEYIEKDIMCCDPFSSIDVNGVGELMKIAIKKAKKIKSNITLSVCGEHGGDAKSIEFFSKLGLSYVSCSPYRIPVAKLAYARATIRKKK